MKNGEVYHIFSGRKPQFSLPFPSAIEDKFLYGISAREKIGIDKLRGDLYKMVAEIHAGRYPFDNFLW